MARRRGTSIRQRRVSAELRAWRKKRRVSCKEVADGLGCSEAKISRMETGERGLYADDVAAILGFLRVPASVRHELLELVRVGEQRNWHEIHGKLPTNWNDLIALENNANAIYNWEVTLVPGLAQTPDYARAVIQGYNSQLTEVEVDGLVATRTSRQVIFCRRQSPLVHLLLDETVLRRPIGDAAMMRAQFRHLLTLAERSKVTVQVVPFDLPAHPGLGGPFVILDLPDEPPVAYVESRSSGSFLEDEDKVESVRLAWRGLQAKALSPQDSARLIASAAGEMTEESNDAETLA